MKNDNQREIQENLVEYPTVEIIDVERENREKKELMKAVIFLNKGRIISLFVAMLYLAIGFVSSGGETAFRVFLFIIFPLALIWFSESMGRYSNPWGGLVGGSPAGIVKFLGWVLLLYPIWGPIFVSVLLHR